MINKATLVGRIGKIDSKSLKNGSNMTTVSMATSRKYTDTAGTKQELTTWHNVNFFSKMADVASKYCHVGDLILVEGEINHKKIESGERAGQWSYSLTASDLKFISSGKSSGTTQVAQPATTASHHAYAGNDYMDHGVPF
jgi:single-strand DNA-binding protein